MLKPLISTLDEWLFNTALPVLVELWRHLFGG